MMKLTTKSLLLTLCVGGAVAASHLAIAHPDNDRRSDRQRPEPFAELDLTDAQTQAIQDLLPLSLAPRQRIGLRTFAPLVFTSSLDEQQLALTVTAAFAQAKAHGLFSAHKKHGVRQILSETQINQWQELREQRQGQREQQPSIAERLQQRLALSDTQREELAPLFDTLSGQREIIASQKQAFREFEQALIAQPEFDAELWLAEFDLMAPATEASALALATTLHSIYLALTEEQQQTLRRLMLRGRPRR